VSTAMRSDRRRLILPSLLIAAAPNPGLLELNLDGYPIGKEKRSNESEQMGEVI
jgi:hypothetical protein